MMKNRTTILNSVLAVEVGLVLLVSMILKIMTPNLIIKAFDIPYIALLSLAALVLTSFFETKEGSWIQETILAGITFGLLPFASGMITVGQILKFTVCGTTVFGVLDVLFCGVINRIEATNLSKASVIPTAFVLYLAYQSFNGWIL